MPLRLSFLAIHVLAWTLFPLLLFWGGSLPDDMTEAWAWGQEFQHGYFKHPPFYSWLAALWFQIFPRTDGAYYLLSALVSAGGLVGAWLLAGRFISGATRDASTLLLALAPFHGVMAINYNANSVLLLLWPWTAYFFVRAIETGKARHGAAFGAVATAALLSKYYSAILLGACALSAIIHSERRRIWSSRAPYAAMVVAALLIAPHLWWISHDGQTITYASRRFGFEAATLAWKATITGAQAFLFQALPLGALLSLIGAGPSLDMFRMAFRSLMRPQWLWVAALAFGPYLLTLVAGTLGTVKLSWSYMIPAFFFVPAALLAGSGTLLDEKQAAGLLRCFVGFVSAALLIAPAIAYANLQGLIPVSRVFEETSALRREIAEETNRQWREAFGQPLRIVASTGAWGHGIAFYAPDSPADLTWFNMQLAPWVTPERLAREGLAIVCVATDRFCLDIAQDNITADAIRREVTVARHVASRSVKATSFVLWFLPPKRADCAE